MGSVISAGKLMPLSQTLNMSAGELVTVLQATDDAASWRVNLTIVQLLSRQARSLV